MKKFSLIFLSLIMFVCGFFIVNDRFANINSVNAASQTIDNMFTPYNLRFTDNWLPYTATFNFSSSSSNCWTDGSNIYYSNTTNQYVLDISTSTWTTKTWTGLTDFFGSSVWTDGSNIYYSNNATNYVLDVATSTWTIKTWTGLINFYGGYVWTDGSSIFYLGGTYDSYILDVSTSTWSVVNFTWDGPSDKYGQYVWTDGSNIYYSSQTYQYQLDVSTLTWTTKTWTGLTEFYGTSVVVINDIVVIPSANSSTWYMLEKDNSSSGGGDETNTYYHFTGSTFNVSAFMSNDAYVTANIYFDIEDISATQFTLKFYYKLLYGYGNNGFSYNVDTDYTLVSYTLNLNTDYSNSFTSGASVDSPFMISYSTDNWTNSDITSCIINSGDGVYNSQFNIGTFVDGYGLVTYTFQYFNSLNEDLNIAIQSTYNKTYLSTNPLLLSNRTYYFSQSSATGSGAYQDGYNAGYNDGVEDGYSNGQLVGRQESYDSGYNAGYELGSSNGYDSGFSAGRLDGIASANEYSFFGLISAVVDAPLNAFTSLLNFNVLGINILNLLTGLITLAIVIAILKMLLGGK